MAIADAVYQLSIGGIMVAWCKLGGNLALFYIHHVNPVNSRNGSAMMTAPWGLPPPGGIAIRRVCWFVRSLVPIGGRECSRRAAALRAPGGVGALRTLFLMQSVVNLAD